MPAEQKEGLTENSEVVPVVNVLEHGYSKVLGNGLCVSEILLNTLFTDRILPLASPSFLLS